MCKENRILSYGFVFSINLSCHLQMVAFLAILVATEYTWFTIYLFIYKAQNSTSYYFKTFPILSTFTTWKVLFVLEVPCMHLTARQQSESFCLLQLRLGLCLRIMWSLTWRLALCLGLWLWNYPISKCSKHKYALKICVSSWICVYGGVKLELVQKHRIILHMPRYSIRKYGNQTQGFTHKRQLSHHKTREPNASVCGKAGA